MIHEPESQMDMSIPDKFNSTSVKFPYEEHPQKPVPPFNSIQQ